MNTDAGHHFNCRKRPLPADGRLPGHFHGPPRKRPLPADGRLPGHFHGPPRKSPLPADGRLPGHFHGPPRKRRVPPVYLEVIPDCFPVLPPEAKDADFDMRNYLFSLPDWVRSRCGNGLRLLRRWASVPQDAPHHAPDLTFLTRDDDVESGCVVRSSRVEDPIKVALKAAAPPPPPPPEKKKQYWEKAFEGTKQYDPKLGEIAVQISLLEKTLEEQRKLAEAPEEDLSGPFIPLTAEEETEVHDCLYSTGSGSKVLVLHKSSNIEVSREKIRCLRPAGWLNDEVINLYLELLKERGIREPKRFLKCHFFNTFFYKKLACGKTGYDYKSVKRWTTSRKLGYELIDCDKIFVPVHQNVHWCLAIINMKAKTLQYLDSLGGNDPRVPRMLAKYIVEEVKDKSNKEIDISSWTEELVNYIPLQQNGWDCGMFMLKYIDFHCRGDSLCFGQEHMEYFRKRTVKEILRQRAD